MSLTLFPLTEWGRFRGLWDRTQGLNPHAQSIAFLGSDYLDICIKHYANPDSLLVHFQQDDIEVVAILEPLNRYQWQAFIPSQLPIAALISSHTTIPPTFWQALFKNLPGLPVQLSFSQLDPLILAPVDHHFPAFTTSWISLEADFETYWSSRSKNLRGNHRNVLNRLKKEGTSVEFKVIDQAEHMTQALYDYGALEASGWKQQAGTAVGGENAQLAFYTEVMSTLAKTGQARVFQFWLCPAGGDRVLIASDLCLDSGPIQILLKTAYAEAYGPLSPSTLLRHEILAFLYLEGKIKTIELYGKRYDWHTRWTEHQRDLYHRNIYRFDWMPKLKQLLSRLKT